MEEKEVVLTWKFLGSVFLVLEFGMEEKENENEKLLNINISKSSFS